MGKKSKQKAQATVETPKMSDKQKAAQQLAITHDLLVSGIFPGGLSEDVTKSRAFLATLHQSILEELEGSTAESIGSVRTETAPDVQAN